MNGLAKRTGAIALLAAAGSVGCGGNEHQFVDLYPVFSSAPNKVDLGEVGPPLVGSGALTISNSGSKTLEVTGTLEGGDGIFWLDAGDVDLSLAPDESLAVVVSFAPETYRAYDARLVLETSDEERPHVVVPVVGVGVDLPFPDVAIEPGQTIEIVDPIPAGDDGYFTFDVVNTGDANLDVSAITLDGGREFTVLRPQPTDLPVTVVPGDRYTAIVEYAPTDTQGDTATVTVASNDPDPAEAELPVLLIGNGGGAFEFPVAVIDCPSTVQLTGPQNVHLSGADSSDPAGLEPLSYRWFVTQRPAASDAGIPLDPSTTEEIDLRVDVAGTWAVQLLVSNAIGTQSLPAVCQFQAVPADDLHVELSWNTPSADLDLHLNLGGNAMFDEPGVCNWCSRSPDWGASGRDDDPRLDIDDQGGLGPENINVLHPAAGGYDVRVHYFDDHGDGPVTATVKVWVLGTEVYAGSRVLEYDQLWSVGQIAWSGSPTFVEDTSPTGDNGARRMCF